MLALGVGEVAQVGQDASVGGRQHLQGATTKGLLLLAHGQHAPRPVEQRMGIAGLGLDVDRLIAVERVHDRRQHQAGWVGAGEAAVAVDRPLHRGTDAIAIAQVDVVTHADFVAVVHRRGTGHGQQQAVEQLDTPTIALQQGREATADTQVDTRPAIRSVVVPEIVPLAVGHHLQGQFIVVAQEDRPLAIRRDLRGLAQNVGDGEAVFLGDGHVHTWHQREVEGHVAFVAIAEVQLGVLRPLVGLGQQHAVRIVGVDLGANLLEHHMGLGKVLVVGTVALHQIGNRVQAQTVDAQVQPVPHDRDDRLHDLGIIEVQVRLVGIEAVPEVLASDRVPGPVGLLGVEEDDAGAVVLLVVIGPDVEVARRRTLLGTPCPLEPGVLVGGVVDDQLGDHPQATGMGLGDESLGIGHGAVVGVNTAVFGDIVAIVTTWRRIERQ